MKININVQLDGSDRDVRFLRAFSKALSDLPPDGLVISTNDEPANVTIYTNPAKVEEAKREINLAPGATVTVDDMTKPVEVKPPKAKSEPKPKAEEAPATSTPKATVDPDTDAANRQNLRSIMLDVTKLKIPGTSISEVKAVLSNLTGCDVVKDIPADRVPAAIEGLSSYLATKTQEASAATDSGEVIL